MQRNSEPHWGIWEKAGREDRHRAKTTNYNARWEGVRGSEGQNWMEIRIVIYALGWKNETPAALLLLLSLPPPSPTSPELFLHLGRVFIVAQPVTLHRHRDGPQPAWLTHTDEVRQNHTTPNSKTVPHTAQNSPHLHDKDNKRIGTGCFLKNCGPERTRISLNDKKKTPDIIQL